MKPLRSRCRSALLFIACALGLAGCRSLGREVNQALPDFLRSDPGAEEIERFEVRRLVFNRTPEERAKARQDFEIAKALFEEGNFDEASKSFESFLESYPDTPEDKEARFLLVRTYIETDEYGDARRSWRNYLGNYPVSEFGTEMEKIGYEMAQSYLNGEQDFFIFDESEEGVKLLEDVARNFPAGDYADDSLWEIANYWFVDEDWIQSQQYFARIVRDYGDSPWAGRAQFNVGLCRLNRIKGPEYDEQNMLEAITDFQTYLTRFPEGDRTEDAKAHIADLRELLSEKHLSIAEWYIGQDKPRAARFYLIRARRLYPETRAADEALKLLETLPEEGPGTPPEIESIPFGPDSQPTSRPEGAGAP